jgi:hypothetical protein
MTDLKLFEDKVLPGAWRVEYFDDDGGCYVTVCRPCKNPI